MERYGIRQTVHYHGSFPWHKLRLSFITDFIRSIARELVSFAITQRAN